MELNHVMQAADRAASGSIACTQPFKPGQRVDSAEIDLSPLALTRLRGRGAQQELVLDPFSIRPIDEKAPPPEPIAAEEQRTGAGLPIDESERAVHPLDQLQYSSLCAARPQLCGKHRRVALRLAHWQPAENLAVPQEHVAVVIAHGLLAELLAAHMQHRPNELQPARKRRLGRLEVRAPRRKASLDLAGSGLGRLRAAAQAAPDAAHV